MFEHSNMIIFDQHLSHTLVICNNGCKCRSTLWNWILEN